MRALLTIDDGLHSPAVGDLRRSLLQSGLEVVTIGPESREAVIAGQRPTSIEAVGDDVRNPVFKMNGSPADGVQVAFGSGLVEPVQVVVSGFEYRGMAGRAGGAVAGAREAASIGCPAIALGFHGAIDVSADQAADSVFQWSGVVVSELAAWLVASPLPSQAILRVEVPRELQGRGLHLAGRSDIDATSVGHITVDPMSLHPQARGAQEALIEWCERAIAWINPRLGVGGDRCHAGCCG